MAYLQDFKERIHHKDYPSFLRLWEEYCYSDQIDGEELKEILSNIKSSLLAASFGLHVERALVLWRSVQDPALSKEILMLILDIQTTNSPALRELALNYLTALYESDPYFIQKIRLVGLKGRDSFQGAIRNFELLNHLAKGKFVFHTSGWGTGEIVDVSFLREEVTAEFDLVVGLKTLSFQNSFHTLIPLADDHFLSRRFGDPDLLEKEAKADSCKFMIQFLRDMGPKSALEIKEALYDLVIPADEWNKWWQATRSKMKKETRILSPSELSDDFALRKEELSHETLLYRALAEKPDMEKLIQLLYSFLRDFPETLKKEEFRTGLQARLRESLNAQDLLVAHKIQLLFFLLDLGVGGSEKEIEQLILSSPSVLELLQGIDILAFKKRLLIIVEKVRADWKELFFALFFQVSGNFLKDFLLQSLEKGCTREELTHNLLQLLLHPTSHPDLFFWYFQRLLEPKTTLPYSDKDGIKRFFEAFLVLLDHLEGRSEEKDLTKKMIQLICADRYKLVRDVMKVTTLEEASEYLLLATKCGDLTDHDIKIIHSLAEVVHPALKAKLSDKELLDQQQDVLWTSESGYRKLQDRIEQIATVERIANAKEIEAARELGDLRENAEYKAALEKRDRLQSELKLLSDQLNRARILTPQDVNHDAIGPGAVVTCLDRQGQELTFTLLGPFDADAERNILSLQSKLAQSMVGKKRGDTFHFQEEEFTITEIGTVFGAKKSKAIKRS